MRNILRQIWLLAGAGFTILGAFRTREDWNYAMSVVMAPDFQNWLFWVGVVSLVAFVLTMDYRPSRRKRGPNVAIDDALFLVAGIVYAEDDTPKLKEARQLVRQKAFDGTVTVWGEEHLGSGATTEVLGKIPRRFWRFHEIHQAVHIIPELEGTIKIEAATKVDQKNTSYYGLHMNSSELAREFPRTILNHYKYKFKKWNLTKKQKSDAERGGSTG